MDIMRLGKKLDGKLLFSTQSEDQLVKSLTGSLGDNVERIVTGIKTVNKGVKFRKEAERKISDLGNPKTAGWTYLINGADPNAEEISRILKPLCEHRGMVNSHQPLLFSSDEESLFDWVSEVYYAPHLEGEPVPQYILIVGNPKQIPFALQVLLSSFASVGRLDFPNLDDLETYVQKLIRIDSLPKPLVTRSATFFAPDGGVSDPTYFSQKYMVEPLADHVIQKHNVSVLTIDGRNAIKSALLEQASKKTAMVYTASHGLGLVGDEPDHMKRQLNGAICCQSEGPLTMEDLFVAEDIPLDQPFFEGSVFFQFACYGYGTPAESEYSHWLDEEGLIKQAENDFIAALPQKMLSHPRGPIVYIGHLDTAFLHGFTEAENPHILERWHSRISPFVSAIDGLFALHPAGLTMKDMSDRYNICNQIITTTYDRLKKKRFSWNEENSKRFLDRWITRGDAQNFMVFGDPAVSLRLPA